MFCPRCGTWNLEGALHCKLCGEGPQPGVAAIDPSWRAAHETSVPLEEVPVYARVLAAIRGVTLDSLVLFFPLATLRVLSGPRHDGASRGPDSTAWWIAS